MTTVPNTNGRTGLCLDPHDLCLAKLAASREKDFIFVEALLSARHVKASVMAERVQDMSSADSRVRARISNYLRRFPPE